MEATDIINAILAGDADQRLRDVARAVALQRKRVSGQRAALLAARLTPGVRVRVGQLVSPAYMRGLVCTVQEAPPVGKKKVLVRAGEARGRISAGEEFRAPMGCLELVNEEGGR